MAYIQGFSERDALALARGEIAEAERSTKWPTIGETLGIARGRVRVIGRRSLPHGATAVLVEMIEPPTASERENPYAIARPIYTETTDPAVVAIAVERLTATLAVVVPGG